MNKISISMVAAAVLCIGAEARVKMVALPERARMVVSLENSNATLLEEERVLALQKGVNKVDFSWKGVNIDPSSIQIRVLSHPSGTIILNTSYPPNENALIWEISSGAAAEERVRISYLLQGLSRDIVYKAVAQPDENSLSFRNYLRLRNDSGEDLSSAEIRIGYGEQFKKTIESGEALEMLSERVDDLPIKKVLTWDSASLPWDPEYEKAAVGIPVSYVIQNEKSAKLGAHTLLPGKVRIFVKTKDGDAKEGVAFTGEDWAALTPPGRELKLYIGQSRDVKVTQRKMKSDRVNLRRDVNGNVVLWDTDEEYKIEIENFKKTAAELVVIEHMGGYWKLGENSHPKEYERTDAFTFQYRLTLPAESTGTKKTTVRFTLNHLNVQGNEPANY